jgi:hypothetical protein
MFSNRTINDVLDEIPDELKTKITALSQYPGIRYDLVITGPVGIGKSTRCDYISSLLTSIAVPVSAFPEYLLGDHSHMSEQLLVEKIEGGISDQTFQSYVLDQWINIAKSKNIRETFNIYERCVDDSILCFCNISNEKGELTDLALQNLYNEARNISRVYGLPSYFDADMQFKLIKSKNKVSDTSRIIDIVANDLRTGIHKRIIGLSLDNISCFERVRERNRDGENKYTLNLISKFVDHYKKLYELLQEGRLKRFLDMGKLL